MAGESSHSVGPLLGGLALTMLWGANAAAGAVPPAIAGLAPVAPARMAPPAYLGMPHRATGKMPARLSATGVFKDVTRLLPADGLMPYDLIVPFWSDGAVKDRWVAIPQAPVGFSATAAWKFPPGTVFVKTFELSTDAKDPRARRRLETRLLVLDESGSAYGVDYQWRADESDADLLDGAATESVRITDAAGNSHTQVWNYPSRSDCLTCHNERAGWVLGASARQMNRDYPYDAGGAENELVHWNRLGIFAPAIAPQDLPRLPKLASPTDASRSLEERTRSYLDANCSHCHQPGGTVAYFDARFETPLERQGLIDGPVLIDQGIDNPRVIAPHDPWRSIALMRVDTVGEIRMPPLARNTVDPTGVDLLRSWILSLPGRPVLAPPSISPVGGTYPGPVQVTLAELEPGVQLRYTLDGSVPGKSDPLYQEPIELNGPAVLRTRAYKDGYTRSIVTQEVFVIGNPPAGAP